MPTTELVLPVVAPYDWPLALRMIGAHAVPGAERPDGGRAHTRLVPGLRGPVQVTVRAGAEGLHAAVGTDEPAEIAAVTASLRRWLDLDLDPQLVLEALGSDVRLAPLVAERPGLRAVGYPDPFEAVVVTVIGQQVSLAAGRSFAGRLVAAYGTPVADGLTAFPTADVLASLAPHDLQATIGVTGARVRTVHAVARLFSEDPPLGPGDVIDPDRRDHVSRRLHALPGIGDWTVQYLRMRLLGDRDALPATDLVLRRALGISRPHDVARIAEAWRPWRSYAVFHLWASTAW